LWYHSGIRKEGKKMAQNTQITEVILYRNPLKAYVWNSFDGLYFFYVLAFGALLIITLLNYEKCVELITNRGLRRFLNKTNIMLIISSILSIAELLLIKMLLMYLLTSF
jgi:hypothetical protein